MKARQWPIILSIAGILIAVAVFVFASASPPAAPPTPSPNGYLDFLKAGPTLATNTSRYDELTGDKLRQLVATNKPALDLVRTGLSRECRVPLGYTKEYMGDGGMSKHLPELAFIKALASALKAEGRLAELEHRNGDAVESYLNTIRLGQESMRGGVLIDGLVGIACQAIGSAGLKTVLTNLDATACHEVIHGLETIEQTQVPYAEVKKNEAAWAQRTFPFYQRVAARVSRLLKPSAFRQVDQKTLQKFQALEKRLRDLMLDLAARAYELEKGKSPQTAEELVPDYLKAIPKDPVSGADMVFEP